MVPACELQDVSAGGAEVRGDLQGRLSMGLAGKEHVQTYRTATDLDFSLPFRLSCFFVLFFFSGSRTQVKAPTTRRSPRRVWDAEVVPEILSGLA